MGLKTSTSIKPLSLIQLQKLPGVIGEISRERFYDYHNSAYSLNDSFPKRLSFYEALAGEGLSVVAEIKGSSPSLGKIADLDPARAARAYYQGGASAISVLTEERHFGGKLEYLRIVADAVNLPLLRKDFIVHPKQIVEAANEGASAVLIIVAVCGEYTADYISFAQELGLDALVEVHDENELDIAVQSNAAIIGVNNRNLQDLSIDLNNAVRLIKRAKAKGFDGLLVAESGYKSAKDLDSIRNIADAALIGSSLAGSANLKEALERIRGL